MVFLLLRMAHRTRKNEVKNAVVDKVLGRTGNTGNVTQVDCLSLR